MLKATADDEHRQVFGAVVARVAEIRGDDDRRAVEQIRVAFLRVAEVGEQHLQLLEQLHLDELELRDVVRVLAVMRQRVVTVRHPFDLHVVLLEIAERYDPRAVGLEGKMRHVADVAELRDDLGSACRVFRRGGIHFRLGRMDPAFGFHEAAFGLAHGLEVFLQFVLVGLREFRLQRFRLALSKVHDAFSVADALNHFLNGVLAFIKK